MSRMGMGVPALERLGLEGDYGYSYMHALEGLAYYLTLTQVHMAGHHVFPYPQIPTGPVYPRLGYFQRLLYYGVEEPELGNISYGDPQFNAPSSGIIRGSGAMLENQQLVQPRVTRNFIGQLADGEAPQKKRKLEGNNSGEGQNAQTSEVREVEELDLELKI